MLQMFLGAARAWLRARISQKPDPLVNLLPAMGLQKCKQNFVQTLNKLIMYILISSSAVI